MQPTQQAPRKTLGERANKGNIAKVIGTLALMALAASCAGTKSDGNWDPMRDYRRSDGTVDYPAAIKDGVLESAGPYSATKR